MFVLLMSVHPVKEHDVQLALNLKHVVRVVEREWKRSRQVHSFFVLLVEHVMDDVKL